MGAAAAGGPWRDSRGCPPAAGSPQGLCEDSGQGQLSLVPSGLSCGPTGTCRLGSDTLWETEGSLRALFFHGDINKWWRFLPQTFQEGLHRCYLCHPLCVEAPCPQGRGAQAWVSFASRRRQFPGHQSWQHKRRLRSPGRDCGMWCTGARGFSIEGSFPLPESLASSRTHFRTEHGATYLTSRLHCNTVLNCAIQSSEGRGTLCLKQKFCLFPQMTVEAPDL